MTFIPSVLSKIDIFNSITSPTSSFIGTLTNTVGYNSITVTIESNINSSSNGFIINFYSDASGSINTYSYTSTYLTGSPFTRVYSIYDSYYNIIYTSDLIPSTLEIRTRLCTSGIGFGSQINSINVFDNTTEYTRDAFGKLRVTEPITLLDLKFSSLDSSGSSINFLNNTLLVCSDVLGTYSATNNSGCLTISGNNSGHYISQSKKFCVYQSGKSLLIKMSGMIQPSDSSGNYVNNFTGRIGFYSNNPNYNPSNNTTPYNGLYFQYDGTGLSVNLANQGSITSYGQNFWNIDPMNGSGSSGITLNFSKAQLFVIDLEWLSVGRIRFGFYVYGQIVYCHEITNINALLAPYTPCINQPVRYELIGSGVGSASITQICSTVISEGGYTPVGRPFTAPVPASISTALYHYNTPPTGSDTPLIAIRGGGANYFHQNILPIVANVSDTQANNISIYRLRLFQNGQGVTATGWSQVDSSNSVVQWTANSTSTSTTNISITSLSNSVLVAQGIVVGRVSVGLENLTTAFSHDVLQITSNISYSNSSNTSDILVLSVQPNGSNSDIYYDLGWNEVW